MTTEETPPPGSDEAVKRGCTCPVLDNAHGKGWLRTGEYWINAACPLHAEPPPPEGDLGD